MVWLECLTLREFLVLASNSRYLNFGRILFFFVYDYFFSTKTHYNLLDEFLKFELLGRTNSFVEFCDELPLSWSILRRLFLPV